jgi:isopenicillin-N epimerase
VGATLVGGGMIASLSSAGAVAAPEPETPAFDPADWASVRAQFQLSPRYVHISNFFLASNPKPVRDAMARHREAFDQNPYTYLEDHMFAKPEDMVWRKVCETAAAYTGGRAEDIAHQHDPGPGNDLQRHQAQSRSGNSHHPP